MRKRLQIPLAVLLVAVAGVIAWQVLREREPVYQGKPVSIWLEGYSCSGPRKDVTPRLGFTADNLQDGNLTYWRSGPSSGSNIVGYQESGLEISYGGVRTAVRAVVMKRPEQEKADKAMGQIGTNAIPTLLRMLRARDFAVTIKLMELVQKQRIILFKPYTPAWVRNLEASIAFESLGVEARDAVPSLVDIYEQNISLASKAYTACSLGYIGPSAKQAVPALLRGAADIDALVRPTAVEALGRIKAQPDLVVPVFIKSLHDSFAPVRCAAVSVLGSFGSESRRAVPALVELLTDPDSNVRERTAEVLKQIDSEAAARAGVN